MSGKKGRPKARNSYILIVLDSRRYDSFVRARPRVMARLGELERRWSYASWTSPSDCHLLIGPLPRSSPRQACTSQYHKQEFLRFNERLGAGGLGFRSLVPKLYLPSFLSDRPGSRSHAMASLPVLNPKTILNLGFDPYKLMDRHNDMRAMLRDMEFSEERPSFYLLNGGETHCPYTLPGEPPDQWPRIGWVHGVFKHLHDYVGGGKLVARADKFLHPAKLRMLPRRQIEAVSYVDPVIDQLFETAPKNTYITSTSDHGELSGEDGYFGHGPIQHRKVFEVPFVEGKLR